MPQLFCVLLWNVDFGFGSPSALLQKTHPISLQKCPSVLEGFSQVQVHFRVRWSILSIFQSESVSSTVCMRSMNISSLKASFTDGLSHSGKLKCNIWPAFFFALSFKSFIFLLHTSCDERKRRRMWANDFSGCQKHFFSFPAGFCHIIKNVLAQPKRQINKKKLSLYKATVWTIYCSHHGSSTTSSHFLILTVTVNLQMLTRLLVTFSPRSFLKK